MTSNPILGVVFHWIGGLASGSFYVPFKGVSGGRGRPTGSWVECLAGFLRPGFSVCC